MGVRAGARHLLEREQELASLRALIDETAQGSPGVAIVEGRAGIGKTQLVLEARRYAAEAGLRTLGARGGELERNFSFGVVRQLFEPELVDAADRERLLDGAAGAAHGVFGVVDDDGEGLGDDASFAILHGLFWLCMNLAAEKPLLLAIDDLHWCDRPSLRFLGYLVRRLEGLPVLVVCSLRPSEPGVDTALLAEIAGDPLGIAVQPRPLSESSVGELVRDRLGDEAEPAFTAACHAATGGNPLLLNELLKALAAEGTPPTEDHLGTVAELGPRAASRAVLLRLGRLSAEAVAVARAAAVLSDGAELVAVASLAGLEQEAAAQATAALSRAEILRPERPLGFVHPLVRDAVYHDIPVGERELQHARAARLLAELRSSGERIAAQLLEVPPQGEAWIAETLLRAAHDASQKGGVESAAAYLSRALAEPPAPELLPRVLLELGLAEALTHGPAGVEHLREAYRELSEPGARALVAQVLARTLLQTGERDEAPAVARRAAEELPAELVDAKRGLVAFEIATALFGVGSPDEQLRRLEPHRAGPLDAGVGAKMLAALASLDWAYCGDGPADDCAALALRARDGGELVAADNGFLAVGPIIVLTLADRDEALDAWDESLAHAHRHGSLYEISTVHLWRGLTFLRRGELADAHGDLETAWDEFERWGYGRLAAVYCSGLLAATRLECGDVEGARNAIELAEHPGFAADGVRYWLNAKLELLVAEGRNEEALAVANELETSYPRARNPAAGSWRSTAALALDRLGRSDEALELATEELRLARIWGAPSARGRALRVLGLLEGDAGIARLEESVGVLDGSPARLERAKSLVALGSALRRARRPGDAREPLRAALELADACGADGLVAQARSELNAAGARPRTPAAAGPASLTASERRVAGLAVDGKTNREIAQALFVTPKTVEVHLSSTYRKLGIRSRRELAGALV